MAVITVSSGDSLSAIAAQYGVSWQEIYELNKSVIGSNPDMIQPGMTLTIPVAGNADPGTSSGSTPTSSGTANDNADDHGQPSGTYSDTITAAELQGIFDRNPGLDQGSFDRILNEINSGTRTIANLQFWAYKLSQSVPTNQPTNLFQVGGEPSVWLDENGQHYLVHYVPGTDIPLRYTISLGELEDLFGAEPFTAQSVTQQSMNAAGAIAAGDSTELANLTDNPFDEWANTVTNQAAVRPWLRDAEVLALIAEAMLEDRDVSLAEFQQTGWWASKNDKQRQWLYLFESDPMSAQQMIEDTKSLVANQLQNMGVNNASQAMIDYVTNKWVTGDWSDTYATLQMQGISDPASGITIDTGLQQAMTGGPGGLDTTQAKEDEVRDLVRKWLGPTFGAWDQNQIAEWAGKLRNDPDAALALENHLRSQRMALFPEYTNESLTYEDIAAPWKSFFQQSWGQVADETDPMFMQIMRTNDAAENGRLLRAEGVKRGIGQVTQSAASEMLGSFGGTVRRPI